MEIIILVTLGLISGYMLVTIHRIYNESKRDALIVSSLHKGYWYLIKIDERSALNMIPEYAILKAGIHVVFVGVVKGDYHFQYPIGERTLSDIFIGHVVIAECKIERLKSEDI